MNKEVKRTKYILLLSTLLIISLYFNIYQFINSQNSEENKNNSSTIILILQAILTIMFSINFFPFFSSKKSNIKYIFKYWNLNSESLKAIKRYVSEVTSKNNPNYIPEEDRIALFDFDGTIYGEKGPLYIEYYMYYDFLKNNPKYLEIEPHKSIYPRLEKSVYAKKLIDFELDYEALVCEAKIYKGYSMEDYKNFVKKFAEKNAKCFKNLKFKDMFYLPMIELVEYLQLNNFIVYVVSATDRFLIREYLKYHFKIPEQNVIATDAELMPKSEEENFNKTGKIDEYLGFNKNDYLIRNGNLIKKNVQLSKVRMIAREIGKKPILSFGNSNSDVPLHNYILTDNKYKAEAYMVVADDIKREYGVDQYDKNGNIDTSNSDKIKKRWQSEEFGYKVISMRDDFKTIYGDNVTLTEYEE